MNYVSRILFFRGKYFKCTKQGIFTIYGSKKSFSVMTNLESHVKVNLLTKSRILMSYTRLHSTLNIKNDNKNERIDFKTAIMLSKFSKLRLELLLDTSANFNEESLLILFKKMCVVYHNNKLDPKFLSNLPLFVNSQEFITFCTLLEKHLPRIMPDELGVLLNLELFKIPTDSVLMRKILTLILDNINNISYLNIMEIYLQLNSNYFKNSDESKRIREACEVYFENTLEDEISHSRNFEELIFFLSENDLPISIKKMIVERILEILNYESLPASLLRRFFLSAFSPTIFPLCSDKIFQAFKDCITMNVATSSQSKFVDVYERAVNQNESLYDEEICEIIAKRTMSSRHHTSHCISTMEKLCLIGHFNEKLLHYVVDSLFGANLSLLHPGTVLQTASVLARTCYHEMNTPIWEKLKEILQSYKPDTSEYFGNLIKLIQWTEYLTFLECDTRNLLSSIFAFANEEQYLKTKNVECLNILRLHHFAEEYFSDGYTKLTKKNLELYLQNSVFPENFYSLTHVYEFFGGEDYVLRNCTNSQKHFIPLVVVLGPDHKPVNLSSNKPKFMKDTTSRVSREIFKVVLNIENIIKPPESRVIAFMFHSDNQPFKYRNAPIMSGTGRIFQKSVRNLGCDLVPLPRKYLYFKEEDKVKYLKSQIDEIIKKTEDEKSSKISESIRKHQ